jgi:hypothetical protein
MQIWFIIIWVFTGNEYMAPKPIGREVATPIQLDTSTLRHEDMPVIMCGTYDEFLRPYRGQFESHGFMP